MLKPCYRTRLRTSSRRASWLAVAATLLFCGAAAIADSDTDMQRSTQTGPAGSRDFFVHLPKGTGAPRQLPLVVLLHGCTQTPQSLELATQMNELADRQGFIVLYPQQTNANNMMSCWNWFDPANLRRGGETELVAAMVSTATHKFSVDMGHVYVVGFSAGAAMASNLLACYPDVFAGGVIHSGLSFDAAESMVEATLAMSRGPNRSPEQMAGRARDCGGATTRPLRVGIWHGNADRTVTAANASQTLNTFLALADLRIPTPVSADWTATTTTIPASPGHLGASITDMKREHAWVQEVIVSGMDHAWSGGVSGQPYTDARGPNASELIMDFLSTRTALDAP